MKFQILYVPIGVGTYHMETARQQFGKSVTFLKSIEEDISIPDDIILSVDSLSEYLSGKNPALIILQNITFANGAYASEILKRFDCPVLLWTLREPVIDGGRLRSNSLTGAFSAANSICAYRGQGNFEFVFGSPGETEVSKKITAVIKAAKLKAELTTLKMAAIGQTPQGFGFGRALDYDLMHTFGVTLEAIEARELIEQAASFSDEECTEDLEEARSKVNGLNNIPEKNIKDFARLYRAYKMYVNTNNIGALASRCWPDFFVSYGTPVCMVLSLLNSLNIPSSCEADVYGALSMYIGSKLSDRSTFFGDPVSFDEADNSITFWHCGMAACDLARKDTGAVVGVHPNRKIGPVMDFGCERCEEATIFRVGRMADGSFRFYIAEGAVLDKPKQFTGTSIVVKTSTPVTDVITSTIMNGWEPHYVIIYKNVALELETLARMLGIDVIKY